MHGVETPAYTRRPPALPAPRDEPRSSLECPLTQELCPAHMHMTCTYAHAHAPVLLYEETLKPQSPSVLTPRFPDPDRPAHTCPANIYCSGARKGVCLSCSCRSRGGENPTETCTYLVTAGEPARAWSPAWDTQRSPRIPAMASSQGVMFVLVPDAKTPATSTVRHVPYLSPTS